MERFIYIAGKNKTTLFNARYIHNISQVAECITIADDETDHEYSFKSEQEASEKLASLKALLEAV